ncbi:thiol-disulfide oxidoreductase [Amylibacter kogurei]|uniref:Thiol-disulfide oxidoreductase n=1 Tax=Paramylibacter kogurei TaxID=1889778 RepID=A0A2G5K1B1_9RHOB|nr:DCC1-like thiol-disulfide oxidoreductase family protein [Amylibacter kogurei]PIB23301.1 thiol-disulfide oxidoreductase [Amylibacter kogurei]
MENSEIPYSFRQVESLDHDGPFTVMDANCSLCAKGAAWIARNDRDGEFRIIPIQTELGQNLLCHYGLDPSDPNSWLFLENGYAYHSLDALIRVGNRFGGVWKLLRILRVLPKPLQDKLYYFVARNRYRFFGRADMCNMPDPAVQKRLMLKA